MLTISQLASYAGVTVRAVRHYHHVGLLPEPERDASGYRSYGAADVVRLIRIRTLAEAGVPLARVQELLEATPEGFADGVARVDAELRTRVRELQEHRRRIARLADGDSLALPVEVTAYLERLRDVGVSERVISGERDGWILAGRPLAGPDPRVHGRQARAAGGPARGGALPGDRRAGRGRPDDARLNAVADLLVEVAEETAPGAELEPYQEEMGDDAVVALIDSYAVGAHPMVERLQQLMAERGWTGWTKMERTSS